MVDPSTLDAVHFEYGPKEFYENTPDPREDDWKSLRKLVMKLSQEDRNIYNDYFIRGLTQDEIAENRGVSQYAISIHLATIHRRLEVYHSLPKVKWSNFYRVLRERQSKNCVLEMTLRCFLDNYSQQITAETLTEQGYPCTQSTVRNRLLRCLTILKGRNMPNHHKHLDILLTSGKVLHNRRSNP